MNTARIIGTLARLLLLLSIVAGSVPASAEIYRWTDERGKVHFGSQKPSGETSGQVETFRGGANVSFVGGGDRKATAAAAKVRMFTTQWCPVCKKAKAYLKKRGTSFEELDVEASRSAKAEFDRMGGKGVPVILVGKQRMDGFDPARMEGMLTDSGL